MSGWIKVTIVLFAVAALAAAGTGVYFWKYSVPKERFRQAALRHTDIVQTISATGTVEPKEVVDVGAQVAGLILSFGKDNAGNPVDYRSVVNAGTVLAQIDDRLYRADLETGKAQLAQAQATLEVSKASLVQMQASLDKASRDWDRAQKMGPGDALAQADYDSYEAAYAVAVANVASAKAQILQGQAGVIAAQVALNKAQENLDYCTITSPVKGEVIDRRVNIGETVVSSLSAPSLFLIAEDLSKIQVWVSVNEADIGSIQSGQAVSFTVDAYTDRVFQGKVGKVRYNATMTNNVVTYTVEIDTDNSDGTLLPYLTANAKFLVAERDDVTAVPNAALRWMPLASMVAPEYADQFASISRRRAFENAGGTSGGRRSSTRPASTQPGSGRGFSHRRDNESGPTTGESSTSVEPHTRGVVWVEDGAFVKPVEVHVGLSDGTNTEIQSDQLNEGQMVIVGQVEQGTGPAGGPSPFMPQLRPPNRQQSGQGSGGGGSGAGSSGGGGGGGGGGGQGH